MSADTPRRAARRAAVQAHDAGQVRMATQERHPIKTTLRSFAQALGGLIPVALVVMPQLKDWLVAHQDAIPPRLYGWAFGAVAVAATLSAGLARLMAMPAFNDWARRWAPFLAPDH